MTSITNTNIAIRPAPVRLRNFSDTTIENVQCEPETIVVDQYHPDFAAVTGAEPAYSLILSSTESSRSPFFHDGCAYLADKDELYATSGLLQSTSSSKLPTVLISRVSFKRSILGGAAPGSEVMSAEWMKLRPPPAVSMPAGMLPYKRGILYCSQGTFDPHSGGLSYMPPGKPPLPILTRFFNKPFNSIHSVVQDKDGGLWFTDPCIGFELDIRPKPQLPSQVYRFDPQTGDLRAVADGFGRPTGIALSPDESTLYITDTDAARPDGTIDLTRAATIYAFDVVVRSGSPFVANKRVFAYALSGVPRALTCDSAGNVYAACPDGVEVWGPGGAHLGLIAVPGGCSSLCFGRAGELFICADQRLWRFQLRATREDLVET
ncbi:calcium-dependent phosphotriesterase [Xylariaceae sp. FL0804]|nr:calcium-dependent phosphotriesterase [Xylariaceae sp. FL0804]